MGDTNADRNLRRPRNQRVSPGRVLTASITRVRSRRAPAAMTSVLLFGEDFSAVAQDRVAPAFVAAAGDILG